MVVAASAADAVDEVGVGRGPKGLNPTLLNLVDMRFASFDFAVDFALESCSSVDWTPEEDMDIEFLFTTESKDAEERDSPDGLNKSPPGSFFNAAILSAMLPLRTAFAVVLEAGVD